MVDLSWWHWAIGGFGLVLAELVLPSFVFIWFGLGAFLVALALLLVDDLSLTTQILIWTLFSIGMTVLWFRVFRRSHHKILVGRASANLVGEVGMIVETVAPFRSGKVRFQKPLVGSDTWSCTAQEEIDVGARVRVEAVEGSVVSVKKMEG